MRSHLSLFKMRFVLLLQYRVAALASACAPLLFGSVMIMVYEAFYRSTSASQPMSFQQTVTYVWLGQALLGIMPWSGDADVMNMIRSGNVAYELCRPLDLYYYWFSRALAMRSAPTLLTATPIMLITMTILPPPYRLRLPASPAAAAAWLLSLVGALLLASAITNLMNIATLWTISGEGIVRLFPAIVLICSGSIVPIPMFPESIQTVLRWLPFSGLFDSPSRLYAGITPPREIVLFFLHQVIWTILLVYLGRWLVTKAMKRVIVQGG